MSSLTNKEIGLRIAEARKDANITAKELAEKISVAASTITRYEKGSISKIKMPVIESIAKVLHVNPMWLLGKSEHKEVKDMMAAWNQTENKKAYYLDPDTAALAQELHDNPQYRALLDSSKKLTPDALREVMNFIDFQTKKEGHEDD